jgi:DNA-binding NarL/FixJ family response regulator
VLRVLLVDDEVLVLRAWRRLFARSYDLVTASSGAEAMAAVQHRSFDVVVTDQWMPGMYGTELLAWLRSTYPACGRVLISAHLDVHCMLAATNDAEADRTLNKTGNAAELRESIAAAAERGRDRAFVEFARRRFGKAQHEQGTTLPGLSDAERDSLTARELEILTLRCAGLPPRKIARRLGIDVSTVQTHQQNVRERFDLPNIDALIARCQRLPITAPSERR